MQNTTQAAPARLDADAEAQRAQHIGPAQRPRRARRQLPLVLGALLDMVVTKWSEAQRWLRAWRRQLGV